MSNAQPLGWFEIARFTRHRLTRAALLAVALVPLFYGALHVWANWDPYGGMEDIPAAIVNEDEMVEMTDAEGNDQPVAIGRLVASELMESDTEGNFDWVITDADDAESGLADGRYAAVLTIPEDLSAAATSTNAEDALDAVTGTIDLRTNDASNHVTGTVAGAITDATVRAMNAQMVQIYLDNIYLGFNDVQTSLAEAADGAGELAAGSEELAGGAGELNAGLDDLAGGTGQLTEGTGRLRDGTSDLAGGVGALSGGAEELSRGLSEASGQVGELPGATRELAEGARAVAEGNRELAEQAGTAATAIEGLTSEVSSRTGELEPLLRELADQCEGAGLDPQLCQELRQAAADTEGLAELLGEPARQAGELRTATAELADGSGQVAAGTEELAEAAGPLASGLNEASSAARLLASGAGELAGGVGRLDAAAGELASGARDLDVGAREARDGSGTLAEGAGELAGGSTELAEGLSDGADEVPTYDEEERDHLSSVASAPFDAESSRDNAVQTYGASLAPYFAATALWLGAIAIFLLLNAIPRRALASTAASWRVALAGFAPAAALSILQAALLVTLFRFGLGIEPASFGWFLGIAVMAGLTFTSISQALIALLGTAGRFVALLLVTVQVAAAGGVFPIGASPGFFQAIHDLLPLAHAVGGMRTAIAGGGVGLQTSLTILTLWLVGAWLVTTWAASRRRMVTIDALHPSLATKTSASGDGS